VHFARVLAQIWYPVKNDCRYLFLDEPLTYLDIFFQYQFLKKIKSLLSQGNMVVVGVLHDLNLVAGFADHIVLLHQGKVLCAGEKEMVLTKESIKTAYKMDALIRKEDEELRIFF
jgi:iron complex transport system ATP-binding protein